MPDGQYATFAEARARLDEIVVEVRKKSLSLERSLDLYEEAIQLGNRCAELVDRPDFTLQEAQAASELLEQGAAELTISGQQVSGADDAGGAEEKSRQANADDGSDTEEG